jgi:hypothetical protein
MTDWSEEQQESSAFIKIVIFISEYSQSTVIIITLSTVPPNTHNQSLRLCTTTMLCRVYLTTFLILKRILKNSLLDLARGPDGFAPFTGSKEHCRFLVVVQYDTSRLVIAFLPGDDQRTLSEKFG